jgi:hypothetical protein
MSSALISLLAASAALSLIGIGAEVIEIRRQARIQHGIDARSERVAGTYQYYERADSKFGDDKYVVTFTIGDRRVEVRLRSLPKGIPRGALLCLEYDAEQPENARPCDTRGDLDDAREGVLIGVGFVVGSATGLGLLIWRRRRDGPDASRETVNDVPVPAYARGEELTLRPSPIARATYTLVFPACPAVVGVAMFQDPTVRPWAIPCALGLAALMAVWLLRIRVQCSDGTVHVYGILPGRHIPASAVTGLTAIGTPVLQWRDRSGRRRSMSLFGFWNGEGAYERVHRHNIREMARLRAWIAANREVSPTSV